jgi:hypothetical protein
MKKLIIILTVTGLLALPSIGLAQTCSKTVIPALVSAGSRLNLIKTALQDYSICPTAPGYSCPPSPPTTHYAVCFIMDPLMVNATDLGSAITIQTGGSETKDVYVKDLKIENDGGDPVGIPLLLATNMGTGKIILQDILLEGAKKGIILASDPVKNGGIELKDSVIEGDGLKEDACVAIGAEGAVLDNVQTSMCGNGALVSSNQVKIKNSKIWDNKIGVEIGTGIVGTDIESSLIYSNDDEVTTGPDDRQRYDGVKIVDGAAHQALFYAIINNEPEVIPDNSDSAINYGVSPAYILLNFSIGQVDPSRIEILTSHPELCGLPPLTDTRFQPCGPVMADGSPIKMNISPAELEGGPKQVVVPPEYRTKDLVVMYSDPGEGTAGISRRFTWSDVAGGVVAFVSNPYDIPTSGGASETELASGGDEEIEQGGGNELEGGGISGEGGGSSILSASSGGCGGGGASLANNSFRHVVFSFNVWWILLALALFGALRFAHVKVSERRKNR